MSITIAISPTTEKKIRQRAKRTGQSVDKLVGELVEDAWEERFPNDEVDETNLGYENPLAPFIGMFSSGKTDTSTRHSEILREGIKMPGGFCGDE